LHIDTGTGWRGGQQQVLWLVEGCRNLGIDQLLLAPRSSPLASRATGVGVETCPLASSPLGIENLRTVRRLTPQFDLIHAHDAHAHSLACAAHPLGGRTAPRLVVARRVGFPLGALSRAKYRFAERYITVSDFVRWRLLDAGIPDEKIRVVWDGVRLPLMAESGQREDFRQRHGAAGGHFILGTLSSFAPEKLLGTQVELLAHLSPEVHFWLGVPGLEATSGTAGAALLDAAKRSGVGGRFRIIPVAEDASTFLSSLDLFLYLSRMEGLGSAILLAMANQLPVVASAVGGIPEIVRHGETGLLVGKGYERELTSAVQFLMRAPQLCQRMGEAGRRFALQHGSSDRMVAQTVGVYEELLAGNTGPRA
jgi:glycosyltransferase involved in cell wall biosynthesis